MKQSTVPWLRLGDTYTLGGQEYAIGVGNGIAPADLLANADGLNETRKLTPATRAAVKQRKAAAPTMAQVVDRLLAAPQSAADRLRAAVGDLIDRTGDDYNTRLSVYYDMFDAVANVPPDATAAEAQEAALMAVTQMDYREVLLELDQHIAAHPLFAHGSWAEVRAAITAALAEIDALQARCESLEGAAAEADPDALILALQNAKTLQARLLEATK